MFKHFPFVKGRAGGLIERGNLIFREETEKGWRESLLELFQ